MMGTRVERRAARLIGVGLQLRPLRLDDGFLLWRWAKRSGEQRDEGDVRTYIKKLLRYPNVAAEFEGRFLGYVIAERAGRELHLMHEDIGSCGPFAKSFVTFSMVRWLLSQPAHHGVTCFRFGAGQGRWMACPSGQGESL